MFIIPPIIVELIGSIGRGGLARYVVLLSPGDVLAHTNDVLFRTFAGTAGGSRARRSLPDPVYIATAIVGIVASRSGLTLRRYRRIAV